MLRPRLHAPDQVSQASANDHDLPTDDFAEALIARSACIFGGSRGPGRPLILASAH
jgi:hypothetical protein